VARGILRSRITYENESHEGTVRDYLKVDVIILGRKSFNGKTFAVKELYTANGGLMPSSVSRI
jgi:hypothetical protein